MKDINQLQRDIHDVQMSFPRYPLRIRVGIDAYHELLSLPYTMMHLKSPTEIDTTICDVPLVLDVNAAKDTLEIEVQYTRRWIMPQHITQRPETGTIEFPFSPVN